MHIIAVSGSKAKAISAETRPAPIQVKTSSISARCSPAIPLSCAIAMQVTTKAAIGAPQEIAMTSGRGISRRRRPRPTP